MKNFVRNILMIIIVFLTIPIVVALIMELNLIWEVETNNDWIGFFGSYIGSIIGVFGVFIVMKLDQRNREEERKEELFLNNLHLYRKISSLMSVDRLLDLKKNISEIKNETNWRMVDTATKHKLKQFEMELYYCDENQGLFNTVQDYISNNLYNELKVTLTIPNNEFNESIEYEEVPKEVLDTITTIIINNSDVKLLNESSIVFSISKYEFIEEFEKNKYSKGYTRNIDSIYNKLDYIEDSKEWKSFIKRREELFNQIHRLKNSINNRVEKVLNY